MSAAAVRLTRAQAREFLSGIDLALVAATGKGAREAAVKFLKSVVPTYSWVGIYAVEGKDLVLDSWSGPLATEHTRIPIGKGICGFAAKAGKTEIVSDVGRDQRYLQCFLSTKSEIVVPIFRQKAVVGEIDIDSDHLGAFTSLDREFLEAIARRLGEIWQ